ncbi:carboxylating nicotinate-nucleotide diphosphorylase [Mangrovibacillus cuniculi]|uniref:Probable nicotinate-nucleotide pyrophosphorylase [carboxylating] n=1 Tax=Mangrovibacillus cuniculi TaxID=2593652 RepID=A0A7S8HFS1_9BACI|nr:carboxylating nicotinate-nucleotide diphosphorylase [Mangrovibacillus cuniculi]QPC47032.1 carboxylating nicotinate-nucleotide diphosphorylase [Mangrovibacillus cuniculi]
MNKLFVKELLQRAFLEDIGSGDLTASAIFPEGLNGEMFFKVKEEGVFCGGFLIEDGYVMLHKDHRVEIFVQEGEYVEKGTVVAKITGPVQSLLSGERVILNLLQRLCGIATLTRKVVQQVEGTKCAIADTRKTTPGLRMLEKYAVKVGGGKNHRFGLYDAVMIKDNHIAFAGSISEAVAKVKNAIGHTVTIEVEVESKEQLLEAIDAEVDIIMIDNTEPSTMKEWVSLVPSSITTEASGGINVTNVREYALTGVNVISLGALTHSYTALDISARVVMEGGN